MLRYLFVPHFVPFCAIKNKILHFHINRATTILNFYPGNITSPPPLSTSQFRYFTFLWTLSFCDSFCAVLCIRKKILLFHINRFIVRLKSQLGNVSSPRQLGILNFVDATLSFVTHFVPICATKGKFCASFCDLKISVGQSYQPPSKLTF